ncbi:GATA transcription factor 17-like isoform X2 [Neltuma alba]|uniref:GATA transcription factor 17-like isoform X2 n=1 Tax=Neltuma alba TaxID=207710 RepID=UPI0010A4C33F|nr:GATA transcription factor 17-like isoform X2 [Prosopis alba]
MVMMDIKESSSDESGDVNKCCTDCRTTKTPLWRGGPAGPKTLCNACGIRYRKRRTSAVRFNRGLDGKRDRAHNSSGDAADAVTVTVISTAATATNDNQVRESVERNTIGWSEEVSLQSVPAVLKKQRCQRKRKLGEVEEAAFCLMALSCGFIFA